MLTILFVAWLLALQPAVNAAPVETKHLTLTTSSGPVTAGKLPLYVDVTPKPAMHVYAPGQPGYIVVELKLDADAPVTAAGKPKYPAGEKVVMAALKETQLVYATPFRITQDVARRAGTGSGALTIKGTLRYQACDDTICYKPATLAISWTVDGAI